MKNLQQLFPRLMKALLLLAGVAILFSPRLASAQCSSSGGWMDADGQNSVEMTMCLYSDPVDGVYGYVEADDTNAPETGWIVGMWAEGILYDNNVGQVLDTGNPCPFGCNGTVTYDGSGGYQNTGSLSDPYTADFDYSQAIPFHTYTLYSSFYSCFDPNDMFSQSCYWYGPNSAGNVSTQGAGVAGYINPKYIVIGVEYSPPGSSSNVGYTNNTVVGTTAATSTSFNNKTSTSVSLTTGAGIPGFLSGNLTTTVSASYAQQSGSSNSVAVSQTVSNTTGLAGYTDPVTGLNHNYDYILVWLNPIATYTVAQSGSNTFVQFNGYGYDLADTRVYNDMDVIGIPVGCLNGYFAANDPSWLPTCADIAGVYARTWAMDNVDGSGPGLTSADLQSILEADPFWTSYTPTLTPGSHTTTDGRFTECYSSGCTQVIPFEPFRSDNYTQGYSTTTTNTQNYSHTQTFAIERKFVGSSFYDTWGVSLQVANETTWVYSTSNAVSNSHGQTSTLNIVGPTPGYSGPLQFVQFQDNYFGTLMLFP